VDEQPRPEVQVHEERRQGARPCRVAHGSAVS
jgi:hypothetical protein